MMNGKSKGYRPLRGLDAFWLRCPGVRFAHPGLYAAVRSADSLTDIVTQVPAQGNGRSVIFYR